MPTRRPPQRRRRNKRRSADRHVREPSRLAQTGTNFSGTSRTVDPTNIYYGGAGIPGVVSGTNVGGTVTYTDTYSTTAVANCSETDSGQLQFASATSMSGNNAERNTCKTTSSISRAGFTKQ
jgi:hypothetical protein